MMQQVHGNNVVGVGKKDIGTTIPDCDAMISNDKSVTLGVRTADCLPISVRDKKGRGIGIIHAGWKGLLNGIINKTVSKMSEEFSIDPGDLLIVIGPHICVNHYEVKDDVSSKFRNYTDAILQKDGKEFLDLAKIAELQLIKSGVLKENIEVDKRCTYKVPSLFSFRLNKTSERILTTV